MQNNNKNIDCSTLKHSLHYPNSMKIMQQATCANTLRYSQNTDNLDLKCVILRTWTGVLGTL